MNPFHVCVLPFNWEKIWIYCFLIKYYCFNPVLFLLQESLNLYPASHSGDVLWIMDALPTGCASFAHHYNLLGEELAICARTAKADWIFHFLHLCGCSWVICLQKGTSSSKLKKGANPKPPNWGIFLFFQRFSFVMYFPVSRIWGRGENSRENRLEGRDIERGPILKKTP